MPNKILKVPNLIYTICRTKAPEKEKLFIAFKPSIQSQLTDRSTFKRFFKNGSNNFYIKASSKS